MSRTVTALYDTKAEAEAARQRLSSAVDVENVKIIDGQSQSSGGGLGGYTLSNDDRHAYGEALRRGGPCSAPRSTATRTATDRRALEETASATSRSARGWQQEGWTPYSEAQGQAVAFGPRFGAGSTRPAPARSRRAHPIVGRVRVGKREIERGGARIALSPRGSGQER